MKKHIAYKERDLVLKNLVVVTCDGSDTLALSGEEISEDFNSLSDYLNDTDISGNMLEMIYWTGEELIGIFLEDE